MINTLDEKKKEAFETSLNVAAFMNGTLAINPFTDEGLTANDNLWAALSAHVANPSQIEPLLLNQIRRTSTVPTQVGNDLRLDLSSGNLNRIVGAGPPPLFASTPVGRALQRFEYFALASNQSVLIRGLPEDKTRLAGGIVGMVTIGAFLYALKQMEAGRELSDDPGTWATEGLNRSGLFNNALEKMGASGSHAGASTLFPNASRRAQARGYPCRSIANSLVGLAAADARGAVTGNAPGMMVGDIAVARRLMPFASLPYWRWLIDGILVPEANRAVRD